MSEELEKMYENRIAELVKERDMWHAELAAQIGDNKQQSFRYSRLISQRDALLKAAHQHVTMGHNQYCQSVRFIPGCDVYLKCDCGFDLARATIKQIAEEQERGK